MKNHDRPLSDWPNDPPEFDFLSLKDMRITVLAVLVICVIIPIIWMYL